MSRPHWLGSDEERTCKKQGLLQGAMGGLVGGIEPVIEAQANGVNIGIDIDALIAAAAAAACAGEDRSPSIVRVAILEFERQAFAHLLLDAEAEEVAVQ